MLPRGVGIHEPWIVPLHAKVAVDSVLHINLTDLTDCVDVHINLDYDRLALLCKKSHTDKILTMDLQSAHYCQLTSFFRVEKRPYTTVIVLWMQQSVEELLDGLFVTYQLTTNRKDLYVKQEQSKPQTFRNV